MVDEEINIKHIDMKHIDMKHIDMKHIDMKHIDMKEKILNKLEGGLHIIKVRRIDWDDGVAVYCEFMKNGIEGSTEFNFIGGEYGIENFIYNGEDRDYVWGEVSEWAEDNIEFTMRLKYKGEDIEMK